MAAKPTIAPILFSLTAGTSTNADTGNEITVMSIVRQTSFAMMMGKFMIILNIDIVFQSFQNFYQNIVCDLVTQKDNKNGIMQKILCLLNAVKRETYAVKRKFFQLF